MASSSTPNIYLSSLHARRERERVESEELLAKHLADPEKQAWAEAYLDYAKSVQRGNEQRGTDYKPHPYSNFKHETCVLCAETIVDDPYGHSPAPFRDDYPSGRCCSACNSRFVIPMRMQMMTAKTGEKAKVRKTMRGLDDFFISRVPPPIEKCWDCGEGVAGKGHFCEECAVEPIMSSSKSQHAGVCRVCAEDDHKVAAFGSYGEDNVPMCRDCKHETGNGDTDDEA